MIDDEAGEGAAENHDEAPVEQAQDLQAPISDLPAAPAVIEQEPETPASAPEVKIVGLVPTGEDGFSGEVRFTAVVDMVFVDGALTEIGFNAAQYSVFKGTNGAGVKSNFTKPRR